MLLDKLNKVRATKTNLFTLQKRFYAELTARFPFIMHADMADMANKLEHELHTLLCASLKYDSVKIPLRSNHRSYSSSSTRTIVNVQRGEPGFYYPNSERGSSDIWYMDSKNYIKDNGDMWYKDVETEYGSSGKEKTRDIDELKAGLSDLRAPNQAKRVYPDKLDAYFKLLKEVMEYRPKFLCYTEEGYGSDSQIVEGIEFQMKNLQFRMLEKSISVRLYEKKDKESYRYHSSSHGRFSYRPDRNDLHRLLDYADPECDTFGTKVHERLKLFIENYEKIRDRFEHEERAKKKAYQTCQGFLKQIRVHTLPFKVLGEIKK